MKHQIIAVIIGFVLSSVSAFAQQPPAADTTSASTGAAALPLPQPAAGFVQPKTPWGDPDLQGFWPGVDMVGVPLQRPARFGTRNTLTEEEFAKRASEIKDEEESLLAEIDVFTADVTTPCAIRCPTSPTPHWQETGKPSRQASLIIDPADGRQPPLSGEGQARQAQQQADAKARIARLQGREADTYLDRSLYDRCITRGVMGSLLPTIYNNGNEIVQGPGYVVIRNEMIHEARVVPLDGRPDLAANITSYMGASRGRWEGNTLVVVTTNFNDKTPATNFQGSTENLKMTERFTLVNPTTIKYEYTLDDPHTWTRPWSAEAYVPRVPPGIFEFACHESNYGVMNVVKGAQIREKELIDKGLPIGGAGGAAGAQ